MELGWSGMLLKTGKWQASLVLSTQGWLLSPPASLSSVDSAPSMSQDTTVHLFLFTSKARPLLPHSDFDNPCCTLEDLQFCFEVSWTAPHRKHRVCTRASGRKQWRGGGGQRAGQPCKLGLLVCHLPSLHLTLPSCLMGPQKEPLSWLW